MRDSFEFIHDNKIIFEEAKKKTICSHCNEKIFKKDLVVMNSQSKFLQKSKFHLNCFRPVFDTPIKNEMTLILIQEKTNKDKITRWIKIWNSLLRKKDPDVNDYEIEVKKKIKTENQKNNLLKLLSPQCLLHILTFFSCEEIHFVIKYVDKTFYQLAWNFVLWKNMCFRDFAPDIISTFHDQGLSLHPRSEDWLYIYIKLRRSACYRCKTSKSVDIKCCPIEKKPICKTCRSSPEFELISLEEIKQEYGYVLWRIFENYIEKYAYTYEGEKVFYKKDVENAFQVYSQRLNITK